MGKKEELKIPGPDATMGEKAEYAWKVILRDIEAEAEKAGKPLSMPEKMMLNGLEDMLPGIFTLAPAQAKKYGEKMFELMSYVLGYSEAPVPAGD